MKKTLRKLLAMTLVTVLFGLTLVACGLGGGNDTGDETPPSSDTTPTPPPSSDVEDVETPNKTYYDILLSEFENGSVSADKTSAEAGEKVTLTVTPNVGYKLTALYLNGEALKGTSFTMPEGNAVVTAEFEKIIVYYDVTVSQAENGSVSADKASAEAGEKVTLTVTPNEGYKLTALYLNGEALEGTIFTMPEGNAVVTAAFEKIVYTITVTQPENGTVYANKADATFGETVILSASAAVAYKIDYYTVNGEKIEGNSFTMPIGNVVVSAHFAEIFAKGENIGYVNGIISTGGVDVSLDKGENPTAKINGGGEQYAYFNDVYGQKFYHEIKVNVENIVNNEAYPKFGILLQGEDFRVAFYVEMATNLTASAVGRVCFKNGVYVWSEASLVSVGALEFTGDNYVTLAVARDGADVYLYVNGKLVICEKGVALLDGNDTAVGQFTFNTTANMKDYFVLNGDDASAKIEQAKADYMKKQGENYGSSGNYSSSVGVDMTYDRGDAPYVLFDGTASPQWAYLKDTFADQIYYQADFNIEAVHNGDEYPKFGMFAQTLHTSMYFYVAMTPDLTATQVGVVYVRDGAWDWDNARFVKVSDMLFTGEDKIQLAVMRDGGDFIFLVNGKFALMVPASELEGEASVFGAFSFNTELTVSGTEVYFSDAKIEEIRSLIPRVGPLVTGTSYYLSEYKYDPATDIITLLRATSSNRTNAALYENGTPVYADRFAVEGTVRIYNTATSGAMASKVEFQVGVNNSHYFKICITRYESSSLKNNSVYIEGVNYKDNGSINTRVKENTLPGGTDYTVDYKVIYDCGTIYFILDGEVQLIYETGWADAGYSFGVVRYADTVWSNTKVSLGDEIEALVQTYKADYMAYKNASELDKDGVIEDNTQKTLSTGELTRVGGTLIAGDLLKDGYNSVYIKGDNGVIAEYRLFNDSGKWGVERIMDNKSEIIIAPANNSYGWMNFEVALAENKAIFMLNGKVYDKLDGSFVTAEVSVGANKVNATLKNSYVHKFADNQSALDYIASAPVYTYYSGYTNSVNSNYNKYFTEGEIVEGGFLIIGASTVAGNFWESWAEDLGLTDYITGYNVGIGGTTTEDWLAAYEKLVKPFKPSAVLISVGGNDLMANGARAIDVVNRLIKIIEMIHADFPDAIIYYPYATPTPNAWENGVWANPGYGLIRQYMKEYLDSCDFAFGIDAIDQMTANGLPINEYFRSDNIHYNELGYSVWSKVLYNSISFPENLGKWEVKSEVPVLDGGMVKFGEEVTMNFAETEFAGEEGLSVFVTDASGKAISVIRTGDIFKFIMPTSNVTVTYELIKKHTNAIWTDEGVLVKGKYTSKRIDQNCVLVVGEHYANQSIADYLPVEITSNVYVFGYAVSTDGGASFGEIITDPSLITLQKDDILKVYFAMMGSALSGNCVLTKYTSNALENNLTLGYEGNKTGTRFWGAVYQNGEIYTGNEYSVDFKLTLFKNAAGENLVSEIYVNSMPTSSITNGRKIFIRWEANSTSIIRQGTDKVGNAYSSGLAKTSTGITVESTDVLSITLDVNITVTSTGFIITISNEQDKTQVYTETYTCADTSNKWENVSINFAFVQMGMATFSDISIKE